MKQVISSSFYLCVLFFQHAISKHWFQFALDQNLLSTLNDPIPKITEVSTIDAKEFQVIKDACFFFLRNASMSNYPGAWDHVLTLNDQALIRNILFVNQDWSNPLSFRVFESCTDFEEIDPFGYYHTLDNIAKQNEDYVLKLIPPHLGNHHKKDSSDRDYQEREVLKTLAKKTPEKLIPVLLDSLINDFNQIGNDKRLIGDYLYMRIDLQDKESLSGRHYLYRLLGVCLKRCAINKPSIFIEFLNQHKRSRYKPLLRLLIFAVKDYEDTFSNELFELFEYLVECEEVRYDSSLATELRMIFETSFVAFNDNKKVKAMEMVSKISHNQDYIHYDKERPIGKRLFCNFGLSKFTWLRKIPKEHLKKSSEFWREYMFLHRKFGAYKEKLPSGSVMAGIVGTPLPAKAYKKMSNDQWLSSFKKYDGSVSRYESDYLKGNIEEHTSAFKNAVKENPTWQKLELIKKAWHAPEVQPIYAVYGLWGWSESNADTHDIVPLFKEIISSVTDEQLLRNCLYVGKNLVRNERDDESIVEFLCGIAMDFKNENPFFEDEEKEEQETSTGGLITKGINTINGSAAEALVHITDKRHSDLVFSTLETVLEKGPKATRSAVLFQFAYLMNVDKERAFGLFLTALLKENDIYVIASSLWSMQYMGNHDFGKLVPVYEKLVVSQKLGPDDSHWLFTILYGSYLHNEPTSDRLIKLLIINNKYACKSAINDIIQNYYLIEGTKQKNDELLDFVLSKATEEDLETLGWNFSASSHIRLNDISGFLKQYIKSSFFKFSDQLIEYLSFQCNSFPMNSIELFELAIQSNKFDKIGRQGIYSNDSGTKFIISAFNALIKNDQTSKTEREKLMKAFDLVLMDYRFRTDTDTLIEDLA
ncbi:MAG TPA: hypothetical protein PLT16_01210 [Daejeonella sp.]|nr:hypothetical protein [Daejeonella sp.]